MPAHTEFLNQYRADLAARKRLEKAAPDLLEALKECSAFVAEFQRGRGVRYIQNDMLIRAKKAIAAAESEPMGDGITDDTAAIQAIITRREKD